MRAFGEKRGMAKHLDAVVRALGGGTGARGAVYRGVQGGERGRVGGTGHGADGLGGGAGIGRGESKGSFFMSTRCAQKLSRNARGLVFY